MKEIAKKITDARAAAMIKLLLARFAPLALVALALPSPLMAQGEAAQAVQPSPHQALLDTMEAGVDQDLVLENAIRTTKQTLRETDRNIAAADALYPGFVDAFGEAMRPFLKEHMSLVRLTYRPRMIERLRQLLSDKEATDLAAFYDSRVGRKLLSGVSREYDSRAVVEQAVKDKNDLVVSSEMIKSDVTRTTNRVIGSLTTEDLAELGKVEQDNPSLIAAVQRMSAGLMDLRVEMENAPMAPGLEERMGAAITETLESHVESYKAGKKS